MPGRRGEGTANLVFLGLTPGAEAQRGICNT